ncbi:MAG: 3-deoxy-7-phosphoheptulonate synthase [Erysipelotrichaceae bacterium]
MNMEFHCKLPIPQEVKKLYPADEKVLKIVDNYTNAIKDILSGKDQRLLLIIGPCSADNSQAVLQYCYQLKQLALKVKDKILIIPRVYTNKPRSKGTGYKGMLHQPDISKQQDLYKGIVAIRQLHLAVVEQIGISSCDEMLYPENHRYINDLVSYVTIGARSSENQQHRMTASGLNIPVGIKNPPSGDLTALINGINAAQNSQDFIYRGWAVSTTGNRFAHGILRGYQTCFTQPCANYHYRDLLALERLYQQANLANPAIIVDCNHCNSNKQYWLQQDIITEVMKHKKANSAIDKLVKGFMVESYLLDGNCKIEDYVFGKSITDPCLGWPKSEELVLKLAELL